MTLGEAIIIAKEMQKWRRSEPPYDGETPKTYKGMPFTTQEFGLAIDQLIGLEETLDELQERCNKAEARNKEMIDKACEYFADWMRRHDDYAQFAVDGLRKAMEE